MQLVQDNIPEVLPQDTFVLRKIFVNNDELNAAQLMEFDVLLFEFNWVDGSNNSLELRLLEPDFPDFYKKFALLRNMTELHVAFVSAITKKDLYTVKFSSTSFSNVSREFNIDDEIGASRLFTYTFENCVEC
jgi:hypothetical protein